MGMVPVAFDTSTPSAPNATEGTVTIPTTRYRVHAQTGYIGTSTQHFQIPEHHAPQPTLLPVNNPALWNDEPTPDTFAFDPAYLDHLDDELVTEKRPKKVQVSIHIYFLLKILTIFLLSIIR